MLQQFTQNGQLPGTMREKGCYRSSSAPGEPAALCPATYLEMARLSAKASSNLPGAKGIAVPDVFDGRTNVAELQGIESLSYLLLYSAEELARVQTMVLSVSRRLRLRLAQVADKDTIAVGGPFSAAATPSTNVGRAVAVLIDFLFAHRTSAEIEEWCTVWFFPPEFLMHAPVTQDADGHVVVADVPTPHALLTPPFMAEAHTVTDLVLRLIPAMDHLLSTSYPGAEPVVAAGDDGGGGGEFSVAKAALASTTVEMEIWSHWVHALMLAMEELLDGVDGPGRGGSGDGAVSVGEWAEELLSNLAVCLDRVIGTRGLLVGLMSALRVHADPVGTVARVTSRLARSKMAFSTG
ncbi:hypothetical protein HK101_001918, partial [Irineochytrium annulatum]